MEASELVRKAEARSRSLRPQGSAESALERLRSEALHFVDEVPEPPLYRRPEDPVKRAAQALLPRAEQLLAQALALGAEPTTARAAEPLLRALRAAVEVLCRVAEGRLQGAEAAWREAVELRRAAAEANRVWRRSDEAASPVFDRATGASRYDPRAPSLVSAKLACPAQGCGATRQYEWEAAHATHAFSCAKCGRPFAAYFGEVRAVEARSSRGATEYEFKIQEPSGALARLELEDPTRAELSVARGDRLAFLYQPERILRGVLNLSTGRVLWVRRSGACFLASAVFGAEAPELEAFRAFRDEVLRRSRLGEVLVDGYYRAGPAAARWLVGRPRARAAARLWLGWLHRLLLRSGFQRE